MNIIGFIIYFILMLAHSNVANPIGLVIGPQSLSNMDGTVNSVLYQVDLQTGTYSSVKETNVTLYGLTSKNATYYYAGGYDSPTLYAITGGDLIMDSFKTLSRSYAASLTYSCQDECVIIYDFLNKGEDSNIDAHILKKVTVTDDGTTEVILSYIKRTDFFGFIALHPQTHVLYGLSQEYFLNEKNQPQSKGTVALSFIDKETGSIYKISILDNITEEGPIDFDSSGNLWTILRDGFYMINVTTGTYTKYADPGSFQTLIDENYYALSGLSIPKNDACTPSAVVAITNNQPSTNTITVQRGSYVSWLNRNSVYHELIFQDFSSGPIAPGSVYSRLFDVAGVYSYRDVISNVSSKRNAIGNEKRQGKAKAKAKGKAKSKGNVTGKGKTNSEETTPTFYVHVI